MSGKQIKKPGNRYGQRRRQVLRIKILLTVSVLLIIGLTTVKLIYDYKHKSSKQNENENQALVVSDDYVWPELDVQLLTVNPYSRSGKKLKSINNIVIHYVG